MTFACYITVIYDYWNSSSMKKLFLTSDGYQVIDKIVSLLPSNPSKLSVAFIPTASDTYDDAPWVKRDRDKLVSVGFNVSDVDIKGKTKQKLLEDLNKNIIFVAGGNVFYLLQELQKNDGLEAIRELVEKGNIYIGSSAGSILAGPSTEFVQDLDHTEKAPELKGFEGLGLTNITPLVHFGSEKFLPRYQKAFDSMYESNQTYISIRNDQVLIVEDDTCKVL